MLDLRMSEILKICTQPWLDTDFSFQTDLFAAIEDAADSPYHGEQTAISRAEFDEVSKEKSGFS
jgi:hypothetical protein